MKAVIEICTFSAGAVAPLSRVQGAGTHPSHLGIRAEATLHSKPTLTLILASYANQHQMPTISECKVCKLWISKWVWVHKKDNDPSYLSGFPAK